MNSPLASRLGGKPLGRLDPLLDQRSEGTAVPLSLGVERQAGVRGVARRFFPWLGLMCICATFVIAVVRVHPTSFFGYYEDDSIYFTTAKALAAGNGYVLASFPGAPTETKYPAFYPWILSWVWRWNPAFPANLTDAIGVTAAFGIAYIVVIFLFLRQMRSMGEVEALFLTGLCAIHPLFIFYSSQVMSDIPFAALALGAIVLAERAIEPEVNPGNAVYSGIVAGFAMLMRVLGVPVAAGIALCFARQRAWRKLASFCVGVAPFLCALAWRVLFPHLVAPQVSQGAASTPGWVRTWAFYGTYLSDWRASVPNAKIFCQMLKVGALLLLRAPAEYFASPWPVSNTVAGDVCAIVITAVILKGILRLAKDSGARTVPPVLGLYAIVVLFWIYLNNGRFWIPFLPVFAAGLWTEIKRFAKIARVGAGEIQPMTHKVCAAALMVVGVILAFAVLLDYAVGLRYYATLSEQRASILREKREIYEWLARSTPADTRVVAFEDAALYLYSGRAAVRPFSVRGGELYGAPKSGQVPHIVDDVARAIGAEYWVVSDDDNGEWSGPSMKGSLLTQTGCALPQIYSSAGGRVRIYSFTCEESAKTGPKKVS